ncbi:MAG: CbiQ family ECF transporter T component [Candidatus Eisenbacteria bacterium]
MKSPLHHFLLDPYQHRTGLIHRLPAAIKLGTALASISLVAMLPRSSALGYAVVASALLGVAALSRVPALHLAKRLLLVEPFALSIALLSLAQQNGFRILAALLVKSTLCLFTLVLLSSTTRFYDILRVLRRARTPAILVTTLALMHRYIFLLTEEMGRMMRARRSRTFSGGRLWVWRSSATIVAHLFVRTSERAERVYAAMSARGWRT